MIKERLAVVYYFPQSDAESAKRFDRAAHAVEGIKFFYTHAKFKGLDKLYADKYTVVVVRSFDDGHKTLSKGTPFTQELIRQFVQMHRFPLLSAFEDETADRVFNNKSSAIIYFADSWDTPAANAFAELSKKRGKELIFATAHIDREPGKKLAEYLGVTASAEGTARLVRFVGSSMNKYKCEKDFADCVEKFKSNKLAQYYKSEPIPQKDEGAVKVVVGDNFKDVVISQDKHVLLEAYAPWCGHCKQLEPIYEELAQKLKRFDQVVIAKMEATSNEFPGFEVKGFPTIRLYKKGKKTSPVEFKGDRTLAGMMEFLEKETGLALSETADSKGEL